MNRHLAVICILHAIYHFTNWCNAEFSNTNNVAPVDPESLLYGYGTKETYKDGVMFVENQRRHPRKVSTHIDKTDSSCSQLLTTYLNKCIDHKLENADDADNRGWSIYDLLTPEEKKIEYNFLVKELDKLFLRIVRLNMKQLMSDQKMSPNNPIVKLKTPLDTPEVMCKKCQVQKKPKSQNNQVQERLAQFTEAYLGILDLLTQQQKLNLNTRRLHNKRKRSTNVSIPLQDFWKLILLSAGLQNQQNLSYPEILQQVNVGKPQSPTTTVSSTTSTTTTERPFTQNRRPSYIKEEVVQLIAFQPQKQFENLVEAVESFRPTHGLFIPDYNFIVDNGLHFSSIPDPVEAVIQKSVKVRPVQSSIFHKELNNTQVNSQNLEGDSSNIQVKYAPFNY